MQSAQHVLRVSALALQKEAHAGCSDCAQLRLTNLVEPLHQSMSRRQEQKLQLTTVTSPKPEKVKVKGMQTRGIEGIATAQVPWTKSLGNVYTNCFTFWIVAITQIASQVGKYCCSSSCIPWIMGRDPWEFSLSRHSTRPSCLQGPRLCKCPKNLSAT